MSRPNSDINSTFSKVGPGVKEHIYENYLQVNKSPACCVFRPAFGCCAHRKAGWNNFFSRFSTFFVHFKAFSVISRLKSLKKHLKWTKIKRGFVYSSKLVDKQKLVDSLRGYLKIVFFRLILQHRQYGKFYPKRIIQKSYPLKSHVKNITHKFYPKKVLPQNWRDLSFVALY